VSGPSPSRLLWGACALLLVFVAMAAVIDPRFGGQDFDPVDPTQLPLFGSTPRIVWVDPVTTDDGLLLRWSAVPGADDYDLVFSAARNQAARDQSEELFREPAVRRAQFTLTRAALPEGVRSGAKLEVRVEARRGGVRVAASGPQRVTAP